MTVTLCKWENECLMTESDTLWMGRWRTVMTESDIVWIGICIYLMTESETVWMGRWRAVWWQRVTLCGWEDDGLCDDRVKQSEWKDKGLCDDRVKPCEWEDDCVTTESDTVWMDFLNMQDSVMAESETVWMGSWRIVWSQSVTLCGWEGKGLCDREWHCVDGKVKDCVTESDTVWMGRWGTVWQRVTLCGWEDEGLCDDREARVTQCE